MNGEMREVNACGKRCPQPIIDIARALKTYTTEDHFILLSDDPATESDLSAWSRLTGHLVEKQSAERFLVSRRA